MLYSATNWLLAVAEPSVEPTLRPGLSDRDVAPGLLGFVVTFAVVVAVIGLMIAMSRRVRRLNHAQGANHIVNATIRTGPAPVDSGAEYRANLAQANANDGKSQTEAESPDAR